MRKSDFIEGSSLNKDIKEGEIFIREVKNDREK